MFQAHDFAREAVGTGKVARAQAHIANVEQFNHRARTVARGIAKRRSTF
jgi:hypothetical protein